MSEKIGYKPEGYHNVTPYLVVNNASGLIEFMKRVFDAEDAVLMHRPDGSVMHAELSIGDSMLMLADASPDEALTSSQLYVYVEDVDDTYQRALAAGASSKQPPTNHFYGDRSAGVEDPYGIRWGFATRVEIVSPEEMQKRMQAMAQG